ncbi:hypothetical protein [Frankia sp. R82]|uniref:hypothetical protein n=1 Tax=Frankia sp. R82 TaxID=2950553 RepID=UPI0020431BE4|nr:hypothetical protein [Frankia sp. R82]
MRHPPRRRATVLTAAVVAAVVAGVLGLLQAYLSRPFWYDEIWRAHVVSEPARSLWAELAVANTPSALGWFGLTRLCGEAFGWHSWALRLPGFAAVPLLGAAMVIVARRFTGIAAAVLAAGWVCLNSTFLDLATQLKPYAVETLAATAILALWMVDSSATAVGAGNLSPRRLERGRLARRAGAGVLALFAVPGIFLIVALAAVDLRRGPARRWRLLECSPALVLAGLHTVIFVAHQSSQRNGSYWDRQFIAGRGPLAALRFVVDQVRLTLTGSPPGIDRFDPSLVHGSLPTGPFGPAAAVLLALVVAGAGGLGARILARRPDGRLLLAALGGAELMMLAASAGRYWPFGPTRTNLFVVPMVIVVVLVGVERATQWLSLALRRQSPGKAPQVDAEGLSTSDPALPPRSLVFIRSLSVFSPRLTAGTGPAGLALVVVALLALVGSGTLLAANSLAGSRLVWDHRDRMRGLDLMVDAAITTRRIAGPGDLVAVGGRLARPGWLYAMEASADGPRDPSHLPPARGGDPARGTGPVAGAAGSAGSAGATDAAAAVVAQGSSRTGQVGRPPRIARADTIFFGGSTAPLAAQITSRPTPPRHLLVFVFDIELRDLTGQLTALTRSGWCPARTWTFRLTGTLTTYNHCSPGAATTAVTGAIASEPGRAVAAAR